MRVRNLLVLSCLAIAACKHPLQIVGEGDIVELNEGVRGCTLEEFQAQATRCTDNDVVGDYNVLYEAQARPGWRFVSWNGLCGDVPRGQCRVNVPASFPAFWDENFPGIPAGALVATFEPADFVGQDQFFLASVFGADDFDPFSALLRAQLFEDGGYSYEAVLESSTFEDSLGSGFYEREDDGLISVSSDDTDFSAGGVATAEFDFLALVDLDASDDEISVALLTESQTDASVATLDGEYFCGFIDTNFSGSIAQALLNGDGTGTVTILESTSGETASGAATYSVTSEGQLTLNFLGSRVVGGIMDDGNVVALTQTDSSTQGAGMCIKSSTSRVLDDMVGEYYGSYIDFNGTTSIRDFRVFSDGSASYTVVADSFGNVVTLPVQLNFAVTPNGRISTGFQQGMVSADGRIAFLLLTRPGGQPEFAVYVRKTD